MQSADPDAIWMMQGWLFVNSPQFWQQPQIKAYLRHISTLRYIIARYLLTIFHLFSGVPDDRMIILDLFSEIQPIWSNTHSYYGKPFIWCMLHNFGGNNGLYGSLPSVNFGPINATVTGSSIVGVGITPEGINQNYIVYDFALEMGWRNESVSLENWVDQYTLRRLGNASGALETNQILLNTVYNSTECCSVTKSMINLRPSFNLLHDGFM